MRRCFRYVFGGVWMSRVQFECLQLISVGFPTPASFQRAFCVSSFWRGYYLYHPKQCICIKMEIAQSDHRLCNFLIFFKMGDSMTHVFVRMFFLSCQILQGKLLYLLYFLHLNWGHSLKIGVGVPGSIFWGLLGVQQPVLGVQVKHVHKQTWCHLWLKSDLKHDAINCIPKPSMGLVMG